MGMELAQKFHLYIKYTKEKLHYEKIIHPCLCSPIEC
jgi:hypothetical protein